jgi:hypothetical protein
MDRPQPGDQGPRLVNVEHHAPSHTKHASFERRFTGSATSVEVKPHTAFVAATNDVMSDCESFRDQPEPSPMDRLRATDNAVFNNG